VLCLLLGALGWLVIASLAGLVASVKLHAPYLLADHPWFTYGRLQPAHLNLLLYGFAVPAGTAVGLWLLARLGRTPLVLPGVAFLGAAFWNLGVLIGLRGILAGDATGFEGLEMPRHANSILFFAYVFLGVPAVQTFRQSREPTLYVSQWFVFAALLWFAWIFSTANLLLLVWPVRGIVQAAIQWWYLNSLQVVCLGFFGLAVLFYLIPKLTGRELHSRYLAMLSFWVIALFGGFGGIHPGAPLPAWMPALSTVGTLFTFVGVVAVLLNLERTLRGRDASGSPGIAFGFACFAALAYVAAAALAAAGAFKSASAVTHFTLFTAGVRQLFLYGFLTVTLFAAVHHLVPRLTAIPWPCPGLVSVTFLGALAGILLQALPLVVGGVLQGRKLDDPSIAFLDASRAGLMFLRLSTLGDLLLVAANAALLGNFVWALARRGRTTVVPFLVEAAREQKTAEARS
jgi:cytochrome c oxidase cbb3-type subunit 1